MLYETAQVPVGDDQRQHLELTREVAERFNNRYGVTFVVPEAVTPPAGGRVMDLQEPTRKMSKSISSPMGSIYLGDTRAEVERKIKRAVTDTDNDVRVDWEKKPGVSNLLEIFASLSGESPATVAARYSGYGDLKGDLASLISETLAPLWERYRELRNDTKRLSEIAALGAEKAAAVSGPVYRRATQAIGLS